ncbi:MAG: DUF4279 domain-containing protein [Actinomycetota bacterium]|jgi:hypothetical protein|nr:DUF4279 domain-containing protein [Actinomycetota bacterium]
MAELDRAVASLRIMSNSLDPHEVTESLGCLPTCSHARGELIVRKRLPPRTASFGLWSLGAPESSPADLDSQVASLVGQLTTDVDVWNHVAANHTVSLFCGWFMKYWNEGATFAPTTLTALGVRSIGLDIDLYGPHGDDNANAGVTPHTE